MAWILRSAVHKAVEVGGNNNLTRTFRSVADSVVQQAGQAVVGGAKLFQDRMPARGLQNFKQAVKRLEEVSVSERGVERVQLLRRWLVALKEIERLSAAVGEPSSTEKSSKSLQPFNESKDSPNKPTVVLYYDPDVGGEPMNFRDVFLHSQALEGITLSMILEAPNEEEVTLLQGIFGLCLTGGKEVHDKTVRSIQDLAKSFSSYEDEVLAKREELLQYAQGAIAGLKINANLVRIDSEMSNMHRNLDEMKALLSSSEGGERRRETMTGEIEEALKEAFAQVRLCSRLQALLLQKNHTDSGDTLEFHSQKVDKLKVLSESLSSSVSKAEKRISDQRIQKDEALNFRVTKTSEVSQLEKELEVEIEALEKRKDELEEELMKVNTSLAYAKARLHIAKEEREQFDAASRQILHHFKSKEEELSKSIASYRTEANVCNAFIKFLEESWVFNSSYNEKKKKQVNEELERYEDRFVNLAIRFLSIYKDELASYISTIRKIVEDLKRLEKAAGLNNNQMDASNPRKKLEEECQNAERMCITTFSLVESIRKQFYTQDTKMSRKNDQRVEEMLDALDKMKNEFESVERPTLEAETLMKRTGTPSPGRSPTRAFLSPKNVSNVKLAPENETQAKTPKANTPRSRLTRNLSAILEPKKDKSSSPKVKGKKSLDPEAELSKLKLELELEDNSESFSTEEIGEWEFDAVHK